MSSGCWSTWRSATLPLKLVLCITFLDAFSYFSAALVLPAHLSAELGFSDSEAGWLYGSFGMLSAIFGVLAGMIIDFISLRSSLLVSSLLLLVGRVILTFSTAQSPVMLALLVFIPIGGAIKYNASVTAIKRLSPEAHRPFFYSLFHVTRFFLITVPQLLSLARWSDPNQTAAGRRRQSDPQTHQPHFAYRSLKLAITSRTPLVSRIGMLTTI
jgi:MFS family permease